MLKERVIAGVSGWAMVAILAAGAIGGVVALLNIEDSTPPIAVAGIIALLVLDLIGWRGLTIVNPNTARVVMLFGRYQGTIKTPGLRWVNPFTNRRFVSLRIRNFESGKLKVNDNIGNPIEIAGRRDCRGHVRSERLRALRARAERVGHSYDGDDLSLRRAH